MSSTPSTSGKGPSFKLDFKAGTAYLALIYDPCTCVIQGKHVELDAVNKAVIGDEVQDTMTDYIFQTTHGPRERLMLERPGKADEIVLSPQQELSVWPTVDQFRQAVLFLLGCARRKWKAELMAVKQAQVRAFSSYGHTLALASGMETTPSGNLVMPIKFEPGATYYRASTALDTIQELSLVRRILNAPAISAPSMDPKDEYVFDNSWFSFVVKPGALKLELTPDQVRSFWATEAEARVATVFHAQNAHSSTI